MDELQAYYMGGIRFFGVYIRVYAVGEPAYEKEWIPHDNRTEAESTLTPDEAKCWVGRHPRNLGWADFEKGTICIWSGLTKERAQEVLAHEFGHWLNHQLGAEDSEGSANCAAIGLMALQSRQLAFFFTPTE